MSRAARFILCVVAWWAAVVTPGVLCLLGAYDVTPEHGVQPGGTAIWFAGWFVQAAFLYLSTRVLGHVRTWWLIVASILPWAVDSAAPYSWGWGLLWIGIAGVVAVTVLLLGLRSLTLDEYGRAVTATVNQVLKNRVNTVTNNVYITRRVLLDIPRADGTTYQGVLRMLCEIGTQPDPGDRIRLRVDPRNPKRFVLAPRDTED